MRRVAVRRRNPVGMRRYCGRPSWQRRVSSVVVCVSQSTCVIAAAADDLSDVSVHRQSRVQCDTKQLDSVTERHYCPCDIDAACRPIALQLGAKQNRFHFKHGENYPRMTANITSNSIHFLRKWVKILPKNGWPNILFFFVTAGASWFHRPYDIEGLTSLTTG